MQTFAWVLYAFVDDRGRTLALWMGFNLLTHLPSPSCPCQGKANLLHKRSRYCHFVSPHWVYFWKQISTLSFLPSFVIPLKEKGGREEGWGLKDRKIARAGAAAGIKGRGVREEVRGLLYCFQEKQLIQDTPLVPFFPPLLFLLSLTNAPIVCSFHTQQHKTSRHTIQTVFCRYRPQLPSSLQILTRAFIACPRRTASASPDGETEWDEAVWWGGSKKKEETRRMDEWSWGGGGGGGGMTSLVVMKFSRLS